MLAIYTGTAIIVSGSGNLIPASGATIEVRREDTGALASIYSDSGGTTPITNPSAFADSSGRFAFYADGIEQGYQITVTKDASSYVLRHQPIGTGAQMDHGEVPGAFFLTGDVTPTQITSNQNDYNPSGLAAASVLRISSDAARSLTGLAGGSDGRVMELRNVGSFNITLENEDAGSTAANRFSLEQDFALAPNHGILLHYDSTVSRWRVMERSNPLVLSGAIGHVPHTLTFNASQTWDAGISNLNRLVLTANITSFAAPTNVKDGSYILYLIQDATGGRTISGWNAFYRWVGGVAPTLSTAANARDAVSMTVVDGIGHCSFAPFQ